jgi:N-acetylneuraminic acid mutarotase
LRPAQSLPVICLVGAVVVATPACDNLPEPLRRDPPAVVWQAGPGLPAPVSNNAVAAVETAEGVSVFSFMGMDESRMWSGVTDAAYRWDVGTDAWTEIESVPGGGRLASTAQVVDGRIYVIGGYTVAEDGTEVSVPDVNVLDPETGAWSRGADIPLPTDDAVSGVWQDSLILLISGWHDSGNVPAVQVYDPALDEWTESTGIAGAPVFGHTGAVVGDVVTYVDWVRADGEDPRFVMDEASWHGEISAGSPLSIDWQPIEQHPGVPLYRAAAGAVGQLAVFVGGTSNPYNYDGIGYDGEPSSPIRQVLAYAEGAHEWRRLAAPPVATMDHRTLGVAGGMVFLVGGMEEEQTVTGRVWYADVEILIGSSF